LAEEENGMIIAPIGSSVCINGKSGSGKSTLLVNLLQDKRFYKGFFDRIFWFSPTAAGDDIQKSLGIKKEDVYTDLKEAPEVLGVILESQQAKLEEAGGADKVKQYAVVFDDVIGDTEFMGCPEFTACFYRVRHANLTTFICSQHWTRIPRVCRLQANFVHYFAGSQSEVELLAEEFAPPCYHKKEFMQIVVDATTEKYSFLTINMKLGWEDRFRKNLDEPIDLPKLYAPDCNEDCDDKENDLNKDGGHEQETAEGGWQASADFRKRADAVNNSWSRRN
jgi:hypothetical protein